MTDGRWFGYGVLFLVLAVICGGLYWHYASEGLPWLGKLVAACFAGAVGVPLGKAALQDLV